MGRAYSMLEHRNTEKILFVKPQETRPLERFRCGRIILKRTLEKLNVMCNRLIWLKIRKIKGLL
jgi:hypothetical protein